MTVSYSAVDKFNVSNGFNQVKFGSPAKILETELNEMQKIQNNQLGLLGKSLITDGFYTKATMTLSGTVLTVPATTVVIGGIAYIILGDMTLSVSSGDIVYLAVINTEVTGDTSLVASGNLSGGAVIANNINDTRMGGLETAHRIQVQFQLTKTNTNSAAIYLAVATMTSGTTFTDNRIKCTVALGDVTKADKIAAPVADDILTMDASGNLKDSGKKVTDLVANTDLIYPVAGGTATALTVTGVTLLNNYPKTFIAGASNGGAATTINGIKAYKPGGTLPPTFVVGKPYTIYYNLAGPNFFVSASAEGTALASQVLAPTTFSNGVDVNIPGTMVDRTGTLLGATGVADGVGDVTLIPPIGFYDGVTAKIKAWDTNFIASNFLSTVSMFGLTGSIPVLTGYRNATGVGKWGNGDLAVYPEKGYQKGGAGDGEIRVSVAQIQSVNGNLQSGNIVNNMEICGIIGNVTIESLGGKKYATGTSTVSTGVILSTINLSGLGFTPSTIMGIGTAIVDGSYQGVGVFYQSNLNTFYYYYQGIGMKLFNTSSYNLSSLNVLQTEGKPVTSGTITWYAYE